MSISQNILLFYDEPRSNSIQPDGQGQNGGNCLLLFIIIIIIIIIININNNVGVRISLHIPRLISWVIKLTII
jgi:hypothetical protein